MLDFTQLREDTITGGTDSRREAKKKRVNASKWGDTDLLKKFSSVNQKGGTFREHAGGGDLHQ